PITVSANAPRSTQVLAPMRTSSGRIARPSWGTSAVPRADGATPKPASPITTPAESRTRSPIRAKPTTDPGPISPSRPMHTPGPITALGPMRVPRPIRVPAATTAPGPISTPSSSCACGWTPPGPLKPIGRYRRAAVRAHRACGSDETITAADAGASAAEAGGTIRAPARLARRAAACLRSLRKPIAPSSASDRGATAWIRASGSPRASSPPPRATIWARDRGARVSKKRGSAMPRRRGRLLRRLGGRGHAAEAERRQRLVQALDHQVGDVHGRVQHIDALPVQQQAAAALLIDLHDDRIDRRGDGQHLLLLGVGQLDLTGLLQLLQLADALLQGLGALLLLGL